MNQEYFTVELASEIVLGIPLANMATVVQFETKNICAVPGVAEFWYGVVNFKGSLLWVLDSDRFFSLSIKNQQATQKLTAIIIKDRLANSQQQVALGTRQLKGIVAVEPSSLKSLANEDTSKLHQCCAAVAQTETGIFYALNATAVLQQLHQRSSLVSI